MAVYHHFHTVILGLGRLVGNAMQITDDAHYERSLKWLTERAAQIEAGDNERNPLKREAWKAERARLMVNYDIVAEALKRYTQPEIFPAEKPKKSVLENFL